MLQLREGVRLGFSPPQGVLCGIPPDCTCTRVCLNLTVSILLFREGLVHHDEVKNLGVDYSAVGIDHIVESFPAHLNLAILARPR